MTLTLHKIQVHSYVSRGQNMANHFFQSYQQLQSQMNLATY